MSIKRDSVGRRGAQDTAKAACARTCRCVCMIVCLPRLPSVTQCQTQTESGRRNRREALWGRSVRGRLISTCFKFLNRKRGSFFFRVITPVMSWLHSWTTFSFTNTLIHSGIQFAGDQERLSDVYIITLIVIKVTAVRSISRMRWQ